VDRWAESDREYDRWAENGPEYDRWAETGPGRDRWAETDRERDRWAETGPEYDRWAETGRGSDRHDRNDRLTRNTGRTKAKWFGLLIAWVIVTGLLLAVHLTILIWVVMVGLIGYVVYAIMRGTPRVARPQRQRATAEPAAGGPERFNAPPGWPEPPSGWTPPPGWQPNPAWPPAPPGWQFWLPPARQDSGGRSTRHRGYRDEADDDRFIDRW
jgi:hypothetical protein